MQAAFLQVHPFDARFFSAVAPFSKAYGCFYYLAFLFSVVFNLVFIFLASISLAIVAFVTQLRGSVFSICIFFCVSICLFVCLYACMYCSLAVAF